MDDVLHNAGASGGKTAPNISFRGDGQTLFKIWISNLILIIFTLGIYYPWAKAKTRKYIYSSTYLGDYNFEFHGEGKQMFIGMVKFFGVILLSILAVVLMVAVRIPGLLIFLAVCAVSPAVLGLFIHGGRRYRMAQTSYRGIRFGYRGKRNELILLMLKGFFFTLITFGIYFPVLVNNLRKYIYDHTRYGNVECRFSGDGGAFWWMVFWGGFLNSITFGIYYFWYAKKLFDFHYQNVSFEKDDSSLMFETHVTPGEFFGLIIVNWLLINCTLGLGFPFAKVRTLQFISDHVTPIGNMDLDNVAQTEEKYSGAMGDDAGDMDFFDFDLW